MSHDIYWQQKTSNLWMVIGPSGDPADLDFANKLSSMKRLAEGLPLIVTLDRRPTWKQVWISLTGRAKVRTFTTQMTHIPGFDSQVAFAYDD